MRRFIFIFFISSVIGSSSPLAGSLRGIIQPAREALLSFPKPEVIKSLPREGDRVEAGSVVATQDERAGKMNLHQAKMQVELARVALEQAQHEKRKKERLLKQNIVAPIAVEEAQFRFREAEAKVYAAEARLRLVELQLSGGELRAPFNAVVKRVHATIGEHRQPGKPVVELMEADQLQIRLDLPLVESSAFKIGESFPLLVEGEEVGLAEVIRIHPFLDPASGMQRVVWSVPTHPKLMTGRYVTIVTPEGGHAR